MTSVEIAEVTGRNHKDVMRSIREMENAWVKVNGRKFALVEYKDAKGELRTPDYVPSHGILKSASELLKAHNAGISAQAFNKLAIKEGFLEKKNRASSNGKTKSFKSITSKGEAYGENQVCPNNPKETQPLWFEDNFGELLTKLLG